MTLDIKFSKAPRKNADTAIIFVFSDKIIGSEAKALDKASKGFLTHTLETYPDFKGKTGENLFLTLPSGMAFKKLVLSGLGEAKKLNALEAEKTGGKICALLHTHKSEHVALFAPEHKDLALLTPDQLAAHLATGLHLRSYKFNKYKSPAKKEEGAKSLSKLDILADDPASMSKIWSAQEHVTAGVFTARDLVNEPPNHLYPESFARFITEELKPLGVEITVLDEVKMKKLGMGAIMAVGQGSKNQPRMVIMRWNGLSGKKKATQKVPLALVGKGVTFDTGGISLKPGAGMDEMKMDMGGAAAVVGTIKALALRKAKTDIVGIVGLAENMPSSNAYRPGDILTSYAGKTIEVLNTDAEGRLVLADALTYIQEQYQPETVIDLATLTGAIIVALGHEYCGIFTNSDKLWNNLDEASTKSGEKVWRMPLDPVWKKDVVSPIADLQNMGKSRGAGSSTAAGFLEHFIEEGVNWAHMDIAGTAWRKTDQPTVPKYGSGFGVQILNAFIRKNYEQE